MRPPANRIGLSPSAPAQYESGAPVSMIGPKSSGAPAHMNRDRPTALAIADHDRLVRVLVQFADVVNEDRLDVVHVGDRLARVRAPGKT